MSYILDALHKSDQERQEKQGPTLQTIHRPHTINKSQGSFSGLKIFSFSTVTLLVLVAIWWFFPLQKDSIKEISGASFAADNKEKIASKIASKNILEESMPMETLPVAEKPTPLKQKKLPLMLVQFRELPNTIQQDIPALTFSFHVFSANPERRTIIINKHRVKEREWVSKDLLLDEITKDGIVLIWKDNYRFSINVVENW